MQFKLWVFQIPKLTSDSSTGINYSSAATGNTKYGVVFLQAFTTCWLFVPPWGFNCQIFLSPKWHMAWEGRTEV